MPDLRDRPHKIKLTFPQYPIERRFAATGHPFGGVFAAQRWLAERGYRHGPMERDNPIGVWSSKNRIDKWSKLPEASRALLDGVIVPETERLGFRDGGAVVRLVRQPPGDSPPLSEPRPVRSPRCTAQGLEAAVCGELRAVAMLLGASAAEAGDWASPLLARVVLRQGARRGLDVPELLDAVAELAGPLSAEGLDAGALPELGPFVLRAAFVDVVNARADRRAEREAQEEATWSDVVVMEVS